GRTADGRVVSAYAVVSGEVGEEAAQGRIGEDAHLVRERHVVTGNVVGTDEPQRVVGVSVGVAAGIDVGLEAEDTIEARFLAGVHGAVALTLEQERDSSARIVGLDGIGTRAEELPGDGLVTVPGTGGLAALRAVGPDVGGGGVNGAVERPAAA